MARIRKLLSLDPDVKAHRKALEILEAHGCSSDFIVECILHYENLLTREELQQVLRESLKELQITEVSVPNPEIQEKSVGNSSSVINQIPSAMFDLMKQI